MLARLNSLARGSRDRSHHRTADQLGERAGDALWRGARLSERGRGGGGCGPRLSAPGCSLTFFKISSRYHRTSRIASEFSRNSNGASHKGHAEETAAAVVAATIEVDGFREFWLASGWLGSSTYANCEWRKVSHAERARFLELARAGRIDTGTDYVGIW
jgi:hypothetical protein